MKELLLVFISGFILLSGKAQVIPTIGDIYNFDIGDEFQSRAPLAPTNVARYVITGKYFSAMSDTVFYVRQNDNWYITLSGGMPPTVTVHTASYVDTAYFTNLIAPVSSELNYIINDSCDSWHDSVYVSSDYCGAQIYENKTCLDCCFEGDFYQETYGSGIGRLYHYHMNPGNMYEEKWEQFYYRKAVSGDSCGTADRLYYAGLKQVEAKKISFYPNPSSGRLSLSNVQNETTIQLYDMYGKLMLKEYIRSDASIDISALSNGIYLLVTNDGKKVSSEKLVIEKK